MKKFAIFLFMILLGFSASSQSFGFCSKKITRAIKNSNFNETATISISVKNVKDLSRVYGYNDKKLLNPASSLKMFTTYSAIDVLGYDYQFKTSLFEDDKNNLYIQLGADPYLTSKQLDDAFKTIKNKSYNAIYFDDYIIDKKEFPKGWMQEDEISSNTPKISSYNLDKNVINLYSKDITKNPVEFYSKSNYPLEIVSKVLFDANKNILEVNRYNWNNPYEIEIEGYINKPCSLTLPLSNMKRYYTFVVNKSLIKNNIKINQAKFVSKKVPCDAVLIFQIKNPVKNAIKTILQESNNYVSESVFKIASFEKYGITGSDKLGRELFKEFYEKLGLSSDKISIKDSCGVSRNNLIYTDWMSDALVKIYQREGFEAYKKYMGHPNTGTLENRLQELEGKVFLKTGTLSDVSSITGYVYSKDKNIYAISMITQGFNRNPKEIKAFEDKIIRLIYSK